MAGSLWIVWTIIGIIGGYMAGRLVSRIRSVTFAVCVGICGAILGGWLFILIGDTMTMQALSLVASAVMCSIFLWILALASPKNGDDSDDDLIV